MRPDRAAEVIESQSRGGPLPSWVVHGEDEAMRLDLDDLGGEVRPPPSRTNRTRRVPQPVLIGHAASLTPY